MRSLRDTIDDVRWRLSGARGHPDPRVSNRWGWAGRTAQVIVSSAVLAGLTWVLIVVPKHGVGSVLIVVATVLALVMPLLYWGVFTDRVLRLRGFGAIGTFVAMAALPLAVVNGADAVLVTTGRTAVCETTSMRQLADADWDGDRWRYMMRCPDGTELSTTRGGPADDPLSVAMRYDPSNRVEAQPQARIDGEAGLQARLWLGLLAVVLLQTAAALIAGVGRTILARDGWD